MLLNKTKHQKTLKRHSYMIFSYSYFHQRKKFHQVLGGVFKVLVVICERQRCMFKLLLLLHSSVMLQMVGNTIKLSLKTTKKKLKQHSPNFDLYLFLKSTHKNQGSRSAAQ